MIMEVNPCNKYKIQISDSKFKCTEANGERGKGFDNPDVSDDLPKVYVVKHGKEIYYVGITRRDIRKRLRDGFSAKGEHGYHGYKWKDQDAAELLIWSFPTNTQEYVEAIEAELVYFIREKTGKWPKYQMEIHFHGASESEKQVAKSILGICLE
jgi:predicted GIY-YIG superfamily endonuclease